MVSIKQKALILRKKLKAHSININSPKSIAVKIDRNQFKHGYDPLIDSIDYGYDKLGNITVPENDRLARIQSGSKAQQVFDEWLANKKGDKGNSGKQKPFILDELKKLNVCKHEFGECLIGAANKTKAGFKVRFMNRKGSDSYVHHVAVLANSATVNHIHSLELIQTVSIRKKSSDARTISHLCGNGGCARPGHLKIERKTVNDERTHCHFVLRKSKSLLQSAMIREACPHEPKCFVNIYEINTPFY
jgi:aspartate carbamoyltransferase regulatory subunit